MAEVIYICFCSVNLRNLLKVMYCTRVSRSALYPTQVSPRVYLD